VQAIMAKARKNRASKQPYVSPAQSTLVGFESPFTKNLNSGNRWVVLSHKIPWDSLVNVYQKQLNNSDTGADGINPRVVIGSLIIKHMCDLSDREVVQQIQENIYMQYFIGYSSFSDEEPFDPSLFVEFRKRLGIEQINAINEKILHMANQKTEEAIRKQQDPPSSPPTVVEAVAISADTTAEPVLITHKGKLIVDATACPQDICYPTDLNLLNDSREKA
jgi:transposase, IS5 family